MFSEKEQRKMLWKHIVALDNQIKQRKIEESKPLNYFNRNFQAGLSIFNMIKSIFLYTRF